MLHSAVRLNDGRVLIVGGADQNATTLSSCEIYDPALGLFTPTGAMATPRVLHGACLMADGRVMVAGDFSGEDEDRRVRVGQKAQPRYQITTITMNR